MPRARACNERGFGGSLAEGSPGDAGGKGLMPKAPTQLVVEDMTLVVRIGWAEEERAHPRPVIVNLTLEVDYDGSDQLSGTVDLYDAVKAVQTLSGEEHRLLERLADRVAGLLLDRFPRIRRVSAAVRKPGPPVGAPVAATGAVAVRSRDG